MSDSVDSPTHQLANSPTERKLIVGLGNPGRKYGGTRHNVGFDVLDEIARRHRLEWESAPRGIESLVARHRDGTSAVSRETRLAKPMTYMNLSGQAVGDLLRF